MPLTNHHNTASHRKKKRGMGKRIEGRRSFGNDRKQRTIGAHHHDEVTVLDRWITCGGSIFLLAMEGLLIGRRGVKRGGGNRQGGG